MRCSDRGRRPSDGARSDYAGSFPGISREGWGAGGAREGIFKLRETGDGTKGVRCASTERGEGGILFTL